MESNNGSERKPLLLPEDGIPTWTPPAKTLTNATLQTLAPNSNNESIPPNSRFLFIAVSKFYNETQRAMDYEDESNTDFNTAINTETSFPSDFNASHLQDHVSQLDPNMSSAAQYSPVYVSNNQQLVNDNESSNSSNPIIILPPNSTESTSASLESTDNENGFSLNSVEENIKLLQQVVSTNPLCQRLENGGAIDSNLKQEDEQVELLITDHNTGLSYALAPDANDINEANDITGMFDKLETNPIRLLDNQNLVLDLHTISHHLGLNHLDANLSQTISEFKTIDSDSMVCTEEVSNLNGGLIDDSDPKIVHINDDMKIEANDFIAVDFLNTEEMNLRRSKRNLYEKESDEDEDEDDIDLFNNCGDCVVEGTALVLCSRHRMLSISDKPVPSRARATLPASYLSINKITSLVSGETVYGVFAKKMIPKRTQFGPIEGILLKEDQIENFSSNNGIELLLEGEDGVMHKLDTNDENLSNWMRFVRKADNVRNQNLILNQMGPSLYYISTCNIAPRQELLVGYSPSYAEKRKLSLFAAERREIPQDLQQEQQWPCFECNLCLNSSDELLKHLSVHDSENNGTKKGKNRKPKVKRNDPPKKLERGGSGDDEVVSSTEQIERDPLSEKENLSDDILNCKRFTCTVCKKMFEQFQLLSLHMCSHQTPTGSDTTVSSSSEEQMHVCPRCGIMLQTRQELISHVDQHSIKEKKNNKCHLCYKCFASPERLQKHMLVHGSEDSKPLQCTTCNKRFLNNSALTCHIKSHRLGKQTFECPICKEAFQQVLLHREHVRTHCIDGIYKCPQCTREFKEYRIIRKHIRAFHCDRKHACLYCCKEFPTTDKLRMHLLKHSDHREFLCAICGQQFKRKDKLQEHTKRIHLGANAKDLLNLGHKQLSVSNKSFGVSSKKFMPKVSPTDYHRFIYKCHCCLVGFKRRGMLVNHLAKRHPDIPPDSVPELNLPILRTTRDYYCQYCDKVYKSSSKRKAHILKNHPGAALPASNRSKDGNNTNTNGNGDGSGTMDSTYSQTVGSITTNPHNCQWCHKQYASKAKLLQHQRKKHFPSVLSHINSTPDNDDNNKAQEQGDCNSKIVMQGDENKKNESNVRNDNASGEENSEFLSTDGFDTDILLAKDDKELSQENEQFSNNDLLNEEVSNADMNVYRNVPHFHIDRIIPIACSNQNTTSSSQIVATTESSSTSIPSITESMLHSLLMGSNTSVPRQWIETNSNSTFSPPYPPH